MLLKHQECICWRLSQAYRTFLLLLHPQSCVLKWQNPCIPLPVLQVMRLTHCQINDSLPCSETLFWIFRWLRQWLCLQLNSGYDLKIFLAIMKVCLACLCISLTLAFSSPCTISMYQETLEKQIYTPLEAMLCCWSVWKKWVRILILI